MALICCLETGQPTNADDCHLSQPLGGVFVRVRNFTKIRFLCKRATQVFLEKFPIDKFSFLVCKEKFGKVYLVKCPCTKAGKKWRNLRVATVHQVKHGKD